MSDSATSPAAIEPPKFVEIGRGDLSVRRAGAPTVEERINRVLGQYEGTNGVPLLDSDDIERALAASGLDQLEGKGRFVRRLKGKWEEQAKTTTEVAAQEAALMGAMNGGKLTSDDMALLKSKYGSAMETSRFASSKVGGFGRGALGAGLGFFGGGFAAFTASMAKGNGFFKSVFVGIGGSVAGLFGGALVHKGADALKEKAGFSFGLGTDNHMTKFEKAMKVAAERGAAVADEYDLEISRIRKGRSFGTEREVAAGARAVEARASEAPVRSAPATTAEVSEVAASERVGMASDKALARLKGKDAELENLLNGGEGRKSFAEMNAKERREIISEMYLTADTARADILSDIDAGRYEAAADKAKAFAAASKSDSVMVSKSELKALVAEGVRKEIDEMKAKGLISGAAEKTEPKVEAAASGLSISGEDKAYLKAIGVSMDAPAAPDEKALADAAPVTGKAIEEKPVVRGKDGVITDASLNADLDAKEAAFMAGKGAAGKAVFSGEADKGSAVVPVAGPAPELVGAGTRGK